MKKVIAVIAIVVVIVFAAAFAKTVPEGHVGVVVTLGSARDDILYPGFHLMSPLDHVINMDCRWQKYYVETSAFSKDMQQVDIKMSMSYALQKQGALKMYKQVGTDYADKIMLPRTLDAVKSTFAKYSAEELVANREQISNEVLAMLSEQLLFYDLSVKEVAIEDIDFTDAFTNAIEAKQVATQTLLQAETEQKQQTLIAEAEAERARIKAEAEAQQRMIRAQADADAVKIAADAEAYRLQQENAYITEMTIRKEMIEKWDGKLPVISGDSSTPIINASDLIGDGAE